MFFTGGDNNTCAIAADGSAWCWGLEGADGQLGNGALTGNQPSPSPVDTAGAIPDIWQAIAIGDFHGCAIGADGSAWCWGGGGSSGRLGTGGTVDVFEPSPSRVDTAGSLLDTWQAIAAGDLHTCAIAAGGSAWCWGLDGEGRLGNGAILTDNNEFSPSRVVGFQENAAVHHLQHRR